MNGYNNGEWLYHYGVKGMKWGVIRERYKVGKAKRAEKKAKQEAKREAIRKRMGTMGYEKSPTHLSDAELNARLKRLDSEERYRTHMAKLHPEKHAKLKKFVTELLTESLKGAAKTAAINIARRATEGGKDTPTSGQRSQQSGKSGNQKKGNTKNTKNTKNTNTSQQNQSYQPPPPSSQLLLTPGKKYRKKKRKTTP